MSAQPAVRPAFPATRGAWWRQSRAPWSQRVAALALITGIGAALLAFAVLAALVPHARPVEPVSGSPAPVVSVAQSGAPWPSEAPSPVVRSAELWYDTAPAPGVWAELKVILDYPLPEGPSKTILLVSDTVMEDFRLRSTEPKLLTPPRRRPDGRFAFVFPAPVAESPNWFRLFLECRNKAPHAPAVGFMLDGDWPQGDHGPVPAQVFRTDRQEDPFMVVPGPLVNWLPGQATTAFPILVIYALAIGGLAAAGCAAALWAVRR
jgi:hypothetical protein